MLITFSDFFSKSIFSTKKYFSMIFLNLIYKLSAFQRPRARLQRVKTTGTADKTLKTNPNLPMPLVFTSWSSYELLSKKKALKCNFSMYFLRMLSNIGSGSGRSVFLQALGDIQTQKNFKFFRHFFLTFSAHRNWE